MRIGQRARIGQQVRVGERAQVGQQVRIGQRVRAAHLSHYCPGGLGIPVTSSNSVGLDLGRAHYLRQSLPTVDDHAAHAAGQICARCRQAIEADQDVRRRAFGDWAHEGCPPVTPC